MRDGQRGHIISRTLSAAFARDGTLYVAGINAYTPPSSESSHGECSATKLEALRPSVSINFPAGVKVDPRGNVATIDSGGPTRERRSTFLLLPDSVP